MAALENTQHEAFAQARFAGKTVTEAHYLAGLAIGEPSEALAKDGSPVSRFSASRLNCAAGEPSDPSSVASAKGEALAEDGFHAVSKASASRLNRLHEVQERIAELFREAAAQTAYDKTNAVRDLLAIIHTPPADADEDHPLCEIRMGKDGPYHRLPPKLQAMSRLIKLMGWDHPVKVEIKRKDNFRDLLARIRRRRPDAPSCSSSSPACNENPAEQNETHWRDQSEAGEGNLGSSCLSPDDQEPSTGDAPQPAEGQATIKAQRSTPLSPRHESFALARVRGLGVMAAYHAAGYTGDTPNLAWRLSAMPEIQARISHLNGGVADAVGYRKDDCIRDLLLVVRSKPSEASPDHPLCEMRLTSWGSFHRFPSKLGALSLLARILGWNAPPKPEPPHDPDLGFKQLREFVARRS